ncbi:hypothetical protein [Verrucomicrobium spinosum]|uniref:hypothetical protein n=1 Tax=Verrucomicrobium spinosum TaxID=2736 RepID=UPI000A7FD88D|nr:hypothetical protein [Verrucomicrobium spinosum]
MKLKHILIIALLAGGITACEKKAGSQTEADKKADEASEKVEQLRTPSKTPPSGW